MVSVFDTQPAPPPPCENASSDIVSPGTNVTLLTSGVTVVLPKFLSHVATTTPFFLILNSPFAQLSAPVSDNNVNV